MKKRKENKYIKLVKQILRNLKNLRVRKYNTKFSKKMYGNWTHIVLLALRQKIDKSYREFTDLLEVCTEILNLLGIKKAPHFTTLQKAAKGYDSEKNHRIVVEDLGAEDRIRLKNKDKPVHRTKGFYRKKAKRRIKRLRANYGSKNETIFSVIKRIQGSMIRSRNVSMQNKELLFKEIAYNAGRLIKNINLFLEEFY